MKKFCGMDLRIVNKQFMAMEITNPDLGGLRCWKGTPEDILEYKYRIGRVCPVRNLEVKYMGSESRNFKPVYHNIIFQNNKLSIYNKLDLFLDNQSIKIMNKSFNLVHEIIGGDFYE